MNILITGNMGYVGPGVVQQLRASHPEARLLGLDTGYFANVLSGEELVEGLDRESSLIRLNVLSDLRRRELLDDDLMWTAAARQMGWRA